MNPLELLNDLFSDYTLRTVALGSAMLGILSGALGTYAVLRKQSLLGDAISHAALPGIALAFLLTGSKAPLVLILGAVAAGWIGTLGVAHSLEQLEKRGWVYRVGPDEWALTSSGLVEAERLARSRGEVGA